MTGSKKDWTNLALKLLNQKRGPELVKCKIMDKFGCPESSAVRSIQDAIKMKKEMKKKYCVKEMKKEEGCENSDRWTKGDWEMQSIGLGGGSSEGKGVMGGGGFVKDGGWVGGDCKPKTIREEADEVFAKIELSKARNEVKNLKKMMGQENSLLEELKSAIKVVKPLPVAIHKKNKDCKDVSVVSVFSDWHYSEVINGREIEGFNNFDVDIAVERVNTYMSKLLDWVALHKNNYNVKEWVVLSVGDNVSGQIHDELLNTNAMPCPQQAIGAGQLLADAIKQGAPHFEKVRIECITNDNHGRLTKKPQCKQSGMNNWSYVVGFVAKEALKHHTNVEFNLHDMYEKVVKIQNKKYLILHGQGIPCMNNIPFSGIQNKIAKEAVARMHMDDSVKFDSMVLGHFHQPAMMPNWIMNGSLSGTTEYDHQSSRHCRPCQVAFFVHPVWGEFDFTPFWL